VVKNPGKFQDLVVRTRKRSRELFNLRRFIDEHAAVYRGIRGTVFADTGTKCR